MESELAPAYAAVDDPGGLTGCGRLNNELAIGARRFAGEAARIALKTI